jgi:hypothetical protein
MKEMLALQTNTLKGFQRFELSTIKYFYCGSTLVLNDQLVEINMVQSNIWNYLVPWTR